MDESMTYFTQVVEKEYFDSFATPDEFIYADIELLKTYAFQNGVTFEECLKSMCRQGDYAAEITRQLSGEQFVIYAFGLDYTGTPLTGLNYREVSTVLVEQSDVTFEIEVSQSDYLEGEGIENPVGVTLDYFSEKGEIEITRALRADTDYVVYAVSVSEECILNSEMVVYEFHTGSVTMSDNQLALEGTNVETRIIDYRITTTNTDPYIVHALEAAPYKGMTQLYVYADPSW